MSPSVIPAAATGSHTIAGPQEYWDRYYAQQFRFGLGTEGILAALMHIPPVETWADLGSGSESMLWAIGLRAQRLVAVDADPQRLAMLRTFTSAVRPRGAHRTALALCGRTDPHGFSLRCRSLTATVEVDCLTGHPPMIRACPPPVSSWSPSSDYSGCAGMPSTSPAASPRHTNSSITADPDFTAVWTYIGRKHRYGHRGARHAVSDTRRATATG